MSILQWKCTNIYLHDLPLLDPPNWFNDSIITFCCDYMQHITFRDNDTIKFVYPATTFIIMYEDDRDILKDMIESNGITKDKLLIFFPITDSSPTEQDGSHWSFVLFSTMDQKYYIFDSARHHGNEIYAKQLITIVAKFLSDKFDHNEDIIIVKSPVQTNNYDCGCYMMMGMRIVTHLLISDLYHQRGASKIDKIFCEHLFLYINELTVTKERSEIKKNIFEIRNKLLLSRMMDIQNVK